MDAILYVAYLVLPLAIVAWTVRADRRERDANLRKVASVNAAYRFRATDVPYSASRYRTPQLKAKDMHDQMVSAEAQQAMRQIAMGDIGNYVRAGQVGGCVALGNYAATTYTHRPVAVMTLAHGAYIGYAASPLELGSTGTTSQHPS